jgi:hypothetical protein
VSMIVSSETTPVLRSAGPRLTRDTIIYRRRLRLKKADLRVPLRSRSPDAHCAHSYAPPGSSEEGGLLTFADAVANDQALHHRHGLEVIGDVRRELHCLAVIPAADTPKARRGDPSCLRGAS